MKAGLKPGFKYGGWILVSLSLQAEANDKES